MPAFKRRNRWHYRVRVTLPDGRAVRVCGHPAIDTKKAAEDAERAHVDRVLNPPKVARERRKMSDVFDRFLTDYVDGANNKASELAGKRSAMRHLRPAFDDLYLDEVSDERIADFAAKLARTTALGRKNKLSGKSRKNILQTLRKCLRWVVKLKWIDVVPEIQMPRVDETEMRHLSDDELRALLTAASGEPRWYAAVMLAADAGLRLGELRALRWTDYNEVTNRLVISRSRWRKLETSPKSRKSRAIPVGATLAAALHANRETKLRGPYVLSTSDGDPLGAEHMNEAIERLTRKAKLDNVGWHSLRHTFCTRLAMANQPPSVIQKLAGHASLATTMRYLHVVPGATDAAIAALDASWARSGRPTQPTPGSSTEAAEIIPFVLVTPLGLEPKFSP